MTEDLIKFAFAAGELAPHLLGRVDIEKFDLGLAEATNYFIDYRGGATTRPGTRFGEFIQDQDEPCRIIRFKFNTEIANTYLLVFSKDKLRFVQDGAYVLETAKNLVDLTPGATTSVEVTAHGFANGDWVYISDVENLSPITDRILQVGSVAADTFEALDHTGASIDTSAYVYGGGAVVQRVYTLVSPYDTADLANLKYHQRNDEIVFTHPDYPVYALVRASATSWTLAAEVIGTTATTPGSVTLTPSSAGTAGMGVVITSINEDGEESLPSRMTFERTSVDYTTTAGSLLITWTAVVGAVKYNVYRTKILPTGSQISYAEPVAYIGSTIGNRFVDNNILGDFTVQPPTYNNPFAHGAITYVEVTAGGANYNATTCTLTATGATTGSGFVGYPIIVGATGAIIGVVIINGGANYDEPVSLVASGGDGNATFDVTVSEASGNNPAAVTVYAQRRTYGGSLNDPLDIWGSQIADFDNFDVSDTPNAADSYSFTLDSDEVNPIRHLMSARSGLLVFTKTEVAQVSGLEGQAISAVGAESDGQLAPGSSQVNPLFVTGKVLYVREKGSSTVAMSYNGFARSWEHEDISTLSAHLFEDTGLDIVNHREIVRWDYAEHPYKLVIAARRDGQMVFLTFLPDQKVIAWTRANTNGLIEDVCVLEENGLDVPYLVVRRYLGGAWVRMFEMLQPRDEQWAEDSWSMDSALNLTPSYPAAELVASVATGAVTFTASAAVFKVSDVGRYIRAGGGKAQITAFTSTTVVVGLWERDMTDTLQNNDDDMPVKQASGTWTLDSAVEEVSGMWHLEGETVSILADGNVKASAVVTAGVVSWTGAASRVVVGLPYTARLRTLPVSVQGITIEGRRKAVKGIVVRTYRTRGLSAGARTDRLFEMKDRSTEQWGDPTDLRSDMQELLFESGYTEDGQFYFYQAYPLPATVLGYVAQVEIGDTGLRGR